MKKPLTLLTALMFTALSYIIAQAFSAEKMNELSNAGLSKTDNPVFDLSIKSNIRCVFQDKKGNMWIGTEGDGVYKLNGKKYTHYSNKDGLPDNYVWNINQDKNGNIWFGTSLGIASFNGMFFIDHTKDKDLRYRSSSCSIVDAKGNILFGTKGGYYKFDGYKLNYIALPISEKDPTKHIQEYSVYSIFEDTDGSLYFGTEFRGISKLKDGMYTFIKEKGLDKAAIRSIHKDKHGTLWFGNNGFGIFTYDGTIIRNLSEEHKLLDPNVFSGKTPEKTLSRVWTITSDIAGNVWIGTIDGGAWRYDGKNFSNFKISDGLQNNGVENIFRDNTGKLWFGMLGGGLSYFDGTKFRVVLKGGDQGC